MQQAASISASDLTSDLDKREDEGEVLAGHFLWLREGHERVLFLMVLMRNVSHVFEHLVPC